MQFGRFAVSGLSLPLSPPHCLLPPAGTGRSTAGDLFSGIAQSLCSANGRQCVRVPVNFLTLPCYPTVEVALSR